MGHNQLCPHLAPVSPECQEGYRVPNARAWHSPATPCGLPAYAEVPRALAEEFRHGVFRWRVRPEGQATAQVGLDELPSSSQASPRRLRTARARAAVPTPPGVSPADSLRGQWAWTGRSVHPECRRTSPCGCPPGPGAERAALPAWLAAKGQGSVQGGAGRPGGGAQVGPPLRPGLLSSSTAARASSSCSPGPSQVDKGRRAPVTHGAQIISISRENEPESP